MELPWIGFTVLLLLTVPVAAAELDFDQLLAADPELTGLKAELSERLPSGDCADLEPRVRLLAEGGVAEAQAMMGTLYAWGCGVEKDLRSSLAWTRIAARQGVVESMVQLGFGEPDSAAAWEWASKAYESGDPAGKWVLGHALLLGRGVEPEVERGANLVRDAAREGVVGAMGLLAEIYRQGWGLRASPSAAFSWARRGSEHGDAYSTNILGVLYATGQGVARDVDRAAELFARAERAGAANARSNLDRLLGESGAGEPVRTAALGSE